MAGREPGHFSIPEMKLFRLFPIWEHVKFAHEAHSLEHISGVCGSAPRRRSGSSPLAHNRKSRQLEFYE